MRYGTVCSGIEAPTVAWHEFGWAPQWFSEIEPFPKAVLAHHYPDVPDLGDMTKVNWSDYAGSVDLVAGGTPCQAFSVAGLRKGLADPRGNLTLEFLRVLDAVRPAWVVWENVPGVLSVDGGRAFGAFLGGLGQLGYGFAYRVLDAQYFGVPQRRRRVFVVGHSGDWRLAAAVLFERHSLQGNPAPRREAREAVAPTLSARTKGGGGLGTDFDLDGGLVQNTVACLDASYARLQGCSGQDTNHGHSHLIAFDPTQVTSAANRSNPQPGDPCHTLAKGAHAPVIAFHERMSSTQYASTENLSPSLGAINPTAVAVRDVAGALTSNYGKQPDNSDTGLGPNLAGNGMRVRRLTPEECESLQGFKRGYTRIPWRGKPADQCPDGPRYKALGNSWATVVGKWIGERIQLMRETMEPT